MIPLAASGGQDRLSPYAAMGNQPEFAVDPEGLLPNVFTQSGGAGMGDLIVGFDGGSLGNRSPFEGSYSNSGGSLDDQSFAEHIQNVAIFRIFKFIESLIDGGNGRGLFVSNFGDGGMNPQSEKKGSKEDTWDVNGDGKLSKREADKHYMKGNEEPITVNGNNIDLSGLKAENMKYNSKTYIYTLGTTEAFKVLPYETAATYGGSTFKLLDGKWQMQSQEYHYKMREWNSLEKVARNILTIFGDPSNTIRPSEMNSLHGKISSVGKSYMIYIIYR